MRVVSQNRDFSFDFDQTTFWMQDEYVYARIDSNNQVIGKYESGQRARQVFIDMHNAYSPIQLMSESLSEEQIAQFVGSKNVPIKCLNLDIPNSSITVFENAIYYMPEE